MIKSQRKMIQNYINHIVFVIDRSGSMGNLKQDVPKVFNAQIQYLARRSKELDQETRVSVYLFNDTIECLIYDMDVMRLPNLEGYYDPKGQTAMIDATVMGVMDLQKVPELYGDHSFLIYVITDGQENASVTNRAVNLNFMISGLPENWTLAVLVPDQDGVHEAKRFGFPANNIQVWNPSAKGLSETGDLLSRVTDSYMQGRSKGVRGTKNLFTIDTSKISQSTVKANLDRMSSGSYRIFDAARTPMQIRDLIDRVHGSYEKGKAFYELTKPEVIQPYKQIYLYEKKSGAVYGGVQARNLLGLPNYEIKVNPEGFGNYVIYVQSTSVNRKIIPGTTVLYELV